MPKPDPHNSPLREEISFSSKEKSSVQQASFGNSSLGIDEVLPLELFEAHTDWQSMILSGHELGFESRGAPSLHYKFENKPLIEIGPGMNPFGLKLAISGRASSYTAIEPFYGEELEIALRQGEPEYQIKTSAVDRRDILQYLQEEQPLNANIFMQRARFHPGEYTQKLSRELVQVLGSSGVLVIADPTMSSNELMASLQNAGFRSFEFESEVSWKMEPQSALMLTREVPEWFTRWTYFEEWGADIGDNEFDSFRSQFDSFSPGVELEPAEKRIAYLSFEQALVTACAVTSRDAQPTVPMVDAAVDIGALEPSEQQSATAYVLECHDNHNGVSILSELCKYYLQLSQLLKREDDQYHRHNKALSAFREEVNIPKKLGLLLHHLTSATASP